ncbi:MAG: hypothetical protein HOV86_18845 [Thermoactinospora sp.]|nr:hypothetical protein [Thermoactinospora sp.]
MKSLGLARRMAALGASTAVLATMVAGLMAGSAQAATSATAGSATSSAAAKPKVSVATPVVSEKHYWGGCPTTVKFSAKIKVKLTGGKTTLAYRWLHGDGSKSKVSTIGLKGSGTKYVTVKQSLTFDENVKGWEALQVLGPRKVTSKKVYFQVECTNGMPTHPTSPSAWAKAWASPDHYVGSCNVGAKINFSGVIKVDDPRWVRYRWILNGDVVDRGAVKVYDARRVGFSFTPRESHRGWAVLQLLGKNAADSNRVHYKVWCKDEAPATVSVSEINVKVNEAVCPATPSADFSATLYASRKTLVHFKWTVGDKVVTGSEWVDGPKTIVGPSRTTTGGATLEVTGPVSITRNANVVLACKPAPSGTVVANWVDADWVNVVCEGTTVKSADLKVTGKFTVTGTKTVDWSLSTAAGVAASGSDALTNESKVVSATVSNASLTGNFGKLVVPGDDELDNISAPTCA